MSTTIKLTPKQIALARGDDDEYQSFNAADNTANAGLQDDQDAGDTGDSDEYQDDGGSGELSDQDTSSTVTGGDEGVSGSGIGEEGQDEGRTGPAWLKDGDLDYAKSYGLSVEDLGQFGNRAELQRFGRLTDQRLMQQRKYGKQEQTQAGSQDDSQQDDTQAAKQGSQAPAGGNVASAGGNAEDELELVDPQKYIDANYDDETIGLAKALRKTQELLKAVLPVAKSLTKNQESEQEKQQEKILVEFEKSLDSLSDPLFGKTGKDGKLLPAQHENRKAVWLAMNEIQESANQAAIASGKTPTQIPVGILVERARSMLFADSPSSRKDAIREQSRRRRPASGGNRGSQMPSGEADPDSPTAIAKSPKLREFWERTQRQNGMR